MKPLYILDLEGTTGIYSTNPYHINDTIQLKSGFKELIELHNNGKTRITIASRVPKRFMDDIVKNLASRGIDLRCKIYTKNDVELPDTEKIYYKNYSQVYIDHGIDKPEDQAIVLGDFLRLPGNNSYSQKDFMNFKFSQNPEVLSQNYSLNDHPFPENKTPVYAVLPQPWTTFRFDNRFSLDMGYVIDFLNGLYSLGNESFQNGLEKMSRHLTNNEHVRDGSLAKRILGINHSQDYLIMKGREENWQPLIEVM